MMQNGPSMRLDVRVETSDAGATSLNPEQMPGRGSSVQFSPVTDWVIEGDMRDDSVDILFQSFLQDALVSSSGMGRDVHSLILSIQHFLYRPRCRPPSKMP